MANPDFFSQDVTADTSPVEGANLARNCAGVRNGVLLCGADAVRAYWAAASPPRHGRYTRNATPAVGLVAPTRCALVAQAGTLPGRLAREAAALAVPTPDTVARTRAAAAPAAPILYLFMRIPLRRSPRRWVRRDRSDVRRRRCRATRTPTAPAASAHPGSEALPQLTYAGNYLHIGDVDA